MAGHVIELSLLRIEVPYPDTKQPHLAFRPDLQGLRAIAILLVLLAHAGVELFRGGFVGVDVFFVLSGYLITGLLVREFEQNGHISLLAFYSRRLKRLLPALAAMLIVTFFISFWLLSGSELFIQLQSAPFAALWTSNLYFSFTDKSYFDELSNHDLLLHTWSLGVEEQYYLIWPVVIGALLLFRARRVAVSTNSIPFVVGIIIFLVSSLALSLYWTQQAPKAAFYLMPSRIWQFALGGMTYHLSQINAISRGITNACLGRRVAWIFLGLGLLSILGSAIALHPGLAYPGIWATVPSLGTVFVILSGQVAGGKKEYLLSHPALVWIGDRSYSLYLWHWPILTLGISLGFQGQPGPIIVLLLISMLAAILSYRLVEVPFWKGPFSQVAPLRVLLVGLLVMASLFSGFYQYLRQTPSSIDAATKLSKQWRADVPLIYRIPCDAWYAHDKVEPCIFGKETAPNTVVFVGDSIGAQWFSMLPAIFPTSTWRIIVFTKSSCPIVDEDLFYPKIKQIYHVCTSWRNAVLDELERIRPQVLIIGNAATYDFSERQWVDGSVRILQRMSLVAENVFVIPGTPALSFDGPGCIARHMSPQGGISPSACSSQIKSEQINMVTGYLSQAIGRFANTHMLDLNDLVCSQGQCNAVSMDGQVIFRDSQHLTDSFVRSRIPIIQERLWRHNLGGGTKQQD